MEKELSFKELIKLVFLRPGMFIPTGSFNEIHSFLSGYFMGVKDTPLSGKSARVFDYYVCIKFGFPTKLERGYVFKQCSKNDEEALSLYQKVLFEFIDLKETMTDDEILAFANRSFKKEEGEPEKLFRIFQKALLQGRENAIRPLIIAHANQHVLWEGAYTEGVAKMLDLLAEGQSIKAIYDTDDQTKVQLITGDFPFPIEMRLMSDGWKIDATKLIELRMSNNKN